MSKGLRHLLLALLLACAVLFLPSPLAMRALAQQGDVHHLVFASDYHGAEGSIRSAMEGMPEDVEYVSLIGDLVGGGFDRAPEYRSQDILDLVQEVFPTLSSSNVSLIWADHDMNVDDGGTDIVKCPGGYGSAPIYQGNNDDGSPAYYIYAVGFYEMREGGAVSEEAAAGFKTWVDSLDPTVPVIVLCHMPLQCKRGDNLGALYWNEALNYAATGIEGIVSTSTTARITRNVIFLTGHNHTVSQDEFYYGAGGTMDVQIDTSSEDGPYSEASLVSRGETVLTAQVDDEELAQEDQELLGSDQVETLADDEGAVTDGEPMPWPRPHHEAKGVTSNIYYTSLVAGYLRTSGNATLITIGDEDIALEKRNGMQTVALGTDAASNSEVESPVLIAQFTREHEYKHASVAVSKVDEAGTPLSGATFTLSREGDALATYGGGDFTLSTSDDALSSFLPAAGETSVWTLRETEAPRGYTKSDAAYEVVVSAEADEALNERTYVNTTTYAMTIEGGQSLAVTNKKVLAPSGPGDSSGAKDKGKGGAAGTRKQNARSTLPQTGDTSDPHAGYLFALSLGLGGLGLLSRRLAA